MKWPTLSLALAAIFDLTSAQTPSDAGAGADLYVQIGQHVIFSYPGEKPPEHLFTLINEGKVGGIILFRENVTPELPQIINRFLTTYEESPAYLGSPLLIMTDQEGGEIRRLPGAPEQTAKEVGASEDPFITAGETGDGAAGTLKGYNMNANLAPVLDVYREEGDFTDRWGRSYSDNTTIVSGCAASFIRSQQKNGVLATAKHFPGLGAAAREENTDERPVTIDLSLDEIRSVDEAPYHHAIRAGVAMIMPSWAVYPALDPEFPAGMSKRWVRDELRGRLGYDGVVITDAIEAGSLEAFGDHGQRGVLAKQAGVDILLASGRNVTQGESIIAALREALEGGELSREEFDQSSRRVQEVRARLA
ncbi:glycoside hydrolase superfamily [Aspergillus karnatakaensis]|uniref:putative glycosyl hydrolase n=1 Tax=Aspergillus karnatakaensis TaxID=1810916 RepID=UPI003CCE263D